MSAASEKFKPPHAGPEPAGRVIDLIYGRYVGQAVCLAAKLGIADHIAAGCATTAALSLALNAKPEPLLRFLRALAAHGLLAETPAGTWTLTPAGELLRSGVPGSLASLARLFATREHALSWLALEHSVLTGESAFEHVHGLDGFSYAQTNETFNVTFNEAMSSIAGAIHRAIADAYDFSAIGTLVDVGGGHGRLMAAILAKFSHLRGIVFDMPHVVTGASAHIEALGLAGRCEAIAGDFFESVPEGADAYIMTAILHDWDDEACVAILRNCRRAMTASGRVLIGDFVLKPANQPDFGRVIDLEMLVMTSGGRERSAEEFREILARAELTIARIIPLPAGHSLIEAKAKG